MNFCHSRTNETESILDQAVKLKTPVSVSALKGTSWNCK
jgi:hypothetical protein